MTSRSSQTRGRTGGGRSRPGRARPASSSSAQPALILGGLAVVVVVVFLVASRGDRTAAASGGNVPAAPAPAAKGAAASPPVQVGKSRAGKTPGEPAPALTAADLQEFQRMLDEAKQLVNEGKNARTGRGDIPAARAKMGEAARVLEAGQDRLAAQLRWQELAELDDWAQPAEYVTLTKLYEMFSKLQKEARMGGG